MAYQLGMDKSLAIKTLCQSGLSQQGIADALGISRGAVIRHWQPILQTVPKRQPGPILQKTLLPRIRPAR